MTSLSEFLIGLGLLLIVVPLMGVVIWGIIVLAMAGSWTSCCLASVAIGAGLIILAKIIDSI